MPETLPVIRVRAEYRHDAVDYEEETKEFYRIKTSILLSRDSFLNITCVHANNTGNYRHTWNLVLNDVAPWLSLIVGHFQVNYGTGLLVGKFAAYNPDPFSYRSPGSQNKTYIPVKSGNPAYAFHGAALTCRGDTGTLLFSLSAFYSMNMRFINEDGYYGGAASCSIGSIESSLDRDYYHSETAVIYNAGLMATAALADLLSFQMYGTGTWLRSQAGDPLSWDGNGTVPPEGTERACGSGITVRYADRYLSIFGEGVLTMAELSNGHAQHAYCRGSGYLFGFRVRHHSVDLSLVRKVTSPDYYAPYNSTIGERSPEKGVFLDGSYRLVPGLKTGISLSGEKKQLPSAADEELPFLLRERLYLEYCRGRVESARLTAKLYRKTYRGKQCESRQVQQSLFLHLTEKTWRLNCNASYGWDSSDKSAFGASLGVVYRLGASSCMVLYNRTVLCNKGSLYSVLAPMDNASIPGIMIRHDSHIITAKASLRLKDLRLDARYLHQLVGRETFRSTVEFAASGMF